MLDIIKENVISKFKKLPLKELPPTKYSQMYYPYYTPILWLYTSNYKIPNINSIFIMKTSSIFSIMNLLTISIMPNPDKNLPFLLIDIMSMFKKRIIFIEYYDCTEKGFKDTKELNEIYDKYKHVENYQVKEAWYVKERMPFSLIKSFNSDKEEELINMVNESVEAYVACAQRADRNKVNEKGLRLLRERMVIEGNPSSGTMEKVLGKDETKEFFYEMVMPIDNNNNE